MAINKTEDEVLSEASSAPEDTPIETNPRTRVTDASYADNINITFNDGNIVYPTSKVVSLAIVEDINNIYRTGEISFIDLDILEKWTMFGIREKEIVNISFRIIAEADVQYLSYRFKMYNIRQTPDVSGMERGKRVFRCDLIEEPIFSKFNHKVIKRSFKEKTSSEIITDILTEEGNIEDKYINISSSENDPIFPSLIVPFWSIEKTLIYLSSYCTGGPYKIFSTHHNQNGSGVKELYYNIVSLKAMYSGFLNSLQSKDKKMINLYVGSSFGSTDGYVIPWSYIIKGPTPSDRINNLSGDSALVFDYFTGKDEEGKILEDIIPDIDIVKYNYNKGDDRYKIEKRNYISLLGGVYHEAVSQPDIVNCGNYLLHETAGNEHEFSTQYHNLRVDTDTKKQVQTKMLNRFYNSYYNQIQLEVEMPGYSDIQIGLVFNITLPSSSKSDAINSVEMHNEVLSGRWVLERKVHKIRVPSDDNLPKYDAVCTFSKTGLELSNSLEEVKDHRKAGE